MDLVRFFEMGAYTLYVWCAYAATGLGLAVILWLGYKRLERERVDARRMRQLEEE